VPPEPELVPPELELVPLEPVVVLPELEFVPPVLAPLDPVLAPPVPEPLPAPELPFVAPPSSEAEVSFEPLEQLPAAATAIIAAPAKNAGRPMRTAEREKPFLAFATFTHEPYCARWRLHEGRPI